MKYNQDRKSKGRANIGYEVEENSEIEESIKE
jgi:hypothetical protein